MIEITLLGTGALFPLPGRALSSALLKCGGHSILFDCGEGTQTAARKAGVSLMRTDIIALTHYHGDHIFGLPGLLQTMLSNGRKEPLLIIGPKGIEKELEPVLKLAGYVGFHISLYEVTDKEINLEGYGFPHGAFLSTFRTEHRVPSAGYRFCLKRAGKFDPEKAKDLRIPVRDWNKLQKGMTVLDGDGNEVTPETVLGPERAGLTVVFSGDTMPCDALTSASSDADLLICDATYGENEQYDLAMEHGHGTYKTAAETALAANCKKLWLTHYSQMIVDPEDYLKNASDIFAASECGTDGKQITLKFEGN